MNTEPPPEPAQCGCPTHIHICAHGAWSFGDRHLGWTLSAGAPRGRASAVGSPDRARPAGLAFYAKLRGYADAGGVLATASCAISALTACRMSCHPETTHAEHHCRLAQTRHQKRPGLLTNDRQGQRETGQHETDILTIPTQQHRSTTCTCVLLSHTQKCTMSAATHGPGHTSLESSSHTVGQPPSLGRAALSASTT